VSASTVIEAPAEALFAALADPHRWAELTPNATLTQAPQPLPSGGHLVHVSGSTFGIRWTAVGETVEYDPPRRIVLAVRDPKVSTVGTLLGTQLADQIIWTVAPANDRDHTRVTVTGVWSRPNWALRLLRPTARVQARMGLRGQLRRLARRGV